MNKKKVIKRISPLFLKGIAHRGYHNAQYTENGIKAFKNALDHNLAIELDVHLTKDNELLVCHDSELERTTGKKGIIEELTLQEIKDNYRLLDGEPLPTLKEVFLLTKEIVPIVVELKVYNKNYSQLAKRVKKELKQIKDKKNIILISFDPRTLIKFQCSGFITQLLVCKEHLWTFKLRYFFNSLDLDYTMLNEKKVQQYSKKHFINCWTIESEAQFDEAILIADTVTFQNFNYQYVVNNLSKKCNK